MEAISLNQAAAHRAIQRDPLNEYLAVLKAENKSKNTMESYSLDLQAFQRWLGRPIETADTPTLAYYFSQLSDLSPATISRKQTSLSMYFQWCVLMQVINSDPMAVIRRTKVPKRLPRPIGDESLKRFFKVLSTACLRDRLLFTLLVETGLRIGEALSLRWDDIDLTPGGEGLIVMGKGQKERCVPLEHAEVSMNLLQRMRRDKSLEAFVFISIGSKALSYSRVHELFHEYVQQAGLTQRVTIHSFRHTFATNLLEDGVNIFVAQKLLGHADIKTTLMYQGVSDELVRNELRKKRNRLTS